MGLVTPKVATHLTTVHHAAEHKAVLSTHLGGGEGGKLTSTAAGLFMSSATGDGSGSVSPVAGDGLATAGDCLATAGDFTATAGRAGLRLGGPGGAFGGA